MIEQYRKIRIELDFNKIPIKEYLKEYSSIIESYIKPPIIPYIKEELVFFIHILLRIEKETPTVQSLAYMSSYAQPSKQYPEGWLGVKESMLFISNQFDNYYYSLDMNYEIEKEYINILTNKKTYLIKTKHGSVMFDEFKQEEIIGKKLNKILDMCIDYIIQPEKRTQIIRKLKINNILD